MQGEPISYGYGGDAYRAYVACTPMFASRLQTGRAAEPRWSER
jgi:hypothetical protein